MVEHTAKEQRVLTYLRFVTTDNEIVHVLERYETSEAALEHLRAFQDKFAERFSNMVSRRRFTVYGTPTAELKTVLDGFGATCLSPLGDLSYWP